MCQNQVLLESGECDEVGAQYNYQLNPEFTESLQGYEETPGGAGAATKVEMERFRSLLEETRRHETTRAGACIHDRSVRIARATTGTPPNRVPRNSRQRATTPR